MAFLPPNEYIYTYFVSLYLLAQIVWLILNEISHNDKMRVLTESTNRIVEATKRLQTITDCEKQY